ncbi:MAG: OmpA family protein [Terriglobales bacterium]
MPHANSRLLFIAAAAMAFAVGCTTKTYVRKQTTPLINHVNQLDELTVKNANAVRDLDSRTTAGLNSVNSSSATAMTAAEKASGDADQVSSKLTQTSHQIESMASTLANLDDYQLSNQSVVHFGFDRYQLSSDAQRTLESVVGSLAQNKHAILEVAGYTDAVGPSGYNDRLSERRADAVVRYLEEHNVPAYRIFPIGLGKNQFVANNATREGRKENRRVELRVMTNSLGRPQAEASISTPR